MHIIGNASQAGTVNSEVPTVIEAKNFSRQQWDFPFGTALSVSVQERHASRRRFRINTLGVGNLNCVYILASYIMVPIGKVIPNKEKYEEEEKPVKKKGPTGLPGQLPAAVCIQTTLA